MSLFWAAALKNQYGRMYVSRREQCEPIKYHLKSKGGEMEREMINKEKRGLINPNHIGVKYPLIVSGKRGGDLSHVYFLPYPLVKKTQGLLTNFCVAWLNAPPLPTNTIRGQWYLNEILNQNMLRTCKRKYLAP